MVFNLGGGNDGCKSMQNGGENHLSPASYEGQQGGLTGGSRRRRLHRTKGKARRARVRSSSAGGKKRGGSRKSKKSGGSRKKSRKHRHSKKCHH